jgi:hypothetical protein
MRSLLLCLVALLAAGTLAVACNTADPSECFPNTGDGFGGSGTIPIGAGVGVSSSGDLFSPPRFGSLGNPPANPCVTGGSDTAQPGATTGGTSTAAGGGGAASSCGMGGAPPGAVADGGDYTCGGGPYQGLLAGYIEGADGGADPTGGIVCSTPIDCSSKCFAAQKYCVEHFVHPYKPPMVGDLYQCIDSFPPASFGGSYTCLYVYPNGDACILARASKLGPIHLPAPPPLCEYKL